MGFLHQALEGVLQVFLPHRCPVTGDIVANGPGLSSSAWRGLTFLAGPQCASCGLPFDQVVPPDTRCAACERSPPRYDQARAAISYDDASRSLLIRYKHGDRSDLSPLLGRFVVSAYRSLSEAPDIVTAVPLHRMRLLQRRFNQAALLARHVGDESGQPCIPDLLIRRRATESQGRKSGLARARNVRGAFVINPRQAKWVKDRHVLLVDDVMTTGATVEECARVLKRGGASRVSVATVARVLRAG